MSTPRLLTKPALALLGALTITASLGCSSDVGSDESELSMDSRANEAIDAMLQNFWSPQIDYFEDQFPSTHHPTRYWNFALAFDAVLDGVERTHGAKYKNHIGPLVDAQKKADPTHNFLCEFFDDEDWMGLALVRAYDLTHDGHYLDVAQRVIDDIMANGLDTGSFGGIWWNRNKQEKATASTFGPVILAARMYERRHDAKYLTFAQNVYANWRAKMVNPTTHQVADHVLNDNNPVWWKFSYNEGLGIGAAVALYRITGDTTYLDDAHGYAGFMLAHESEPTSFGKILSDGNNCSGACDAFKGVAYRYLAELYHLDESKSEYRKVLSASAKSIWAFATNRSRGTFASDWSGPKQSSVTLAAEASAATALNLGAEL